MHSCIYSSTSLLWPGIKRAHRCYIIIRELPLERAASDGAWRFSFSWCN